MSGKEGYHVLRLIEHRQTCYISSEYIKGSTLAEWVKYHPVAEKRVLFQIIRGMVQQLSGIHRCRGNPCYRYVNPFSIIVAADGSVNFLDMNAESNVGELRGMQRRAVREHFLPPEEPYYRQESVALDLYGLGRTIQYVLAQVEPEPRLKKSEEFKLRRITARCLQGESKRSFKKASEILQLLPVWEESRGRKKKDPGFKTEQAQSADRAQGAGWDQKTDRARGTGRVKRADRAIKPEGVWKTRFALAFLRAVCVLAAGFFAVALILRYLPEELRPGRKAVMEERTEGTRERTAEKPSGDGVEKTAEGAAVVSSADVPPLMPTSEDQLNLELGLLHFLAFEDYEKSGEYFRKAGENEESERLFKIASCLAETPAPAGELRAALIGLEKVLDERDTGGSTGNAGNEKDLYHCILRGFSRLDGQEDAQHLLQAGERYLSLDAKPPAGRDPESQSEMEEPALHGGAEEPVSQSRSNSSAMQNETEEPALHGGADESVSQSRSNSSALQSEMEEPALHGGAEEPVSQSRSNGSALQSETVKNRARSEVLGCMAKACERLGRTEEALKKYGEQIACAPEGAVQEEVFHRASELAAADGEIGKALSLLKKGISHYGSSAALRVAFIRLQFQNPRLGRRRVIKEIQEQLREMPKLKDDKTFREVLREHRLAIKEGS